MITALKKIRRNYTVIELLVVIVVIGILLAASMGGLSMMNKRQGATGAVRTISSKISMARSYAVMKNTYVAILIPDDSAYSSFNSNDLKPYRFTKSRICIVRDFDPTATPAMTAKFYAWIDGNNWESVPSGTCGYINVGQNKIIDIKNPEDSSGPVVSSSAIIFKPNGTLASGTDASINVFLAKYDISSGLKYDTKSKESKGWSVFINAFTGRSEYVKNN